MSPIIITHGLKVLGGIVGGGMTAGVGVVAAVGAAIGYGVSKLAGGSSKVTWTVTCPHCGAQYVIDDAQHLALKGQTVRCDGGCGKTFVCG